MSSSVDPKQREQRRHPLRWFGRSLKATTNVFRPGRKRVLAECDNIDDVDRNVASAPSFRAPTADIQAAFATIFPHDMTHIISQRTQSLVSSLSRMLALSDDSAEADETLAARGFPRQFTPTTYLPAAGLPASGLQLQDLTTTGHKQWGSWWDGRGLLRVKLYDFAIYTNKQQVSQLSEEGAGRARQARRRRRASPSELAICETVRGSHGVEMSLAVRPARDLPLHIMATEYQRILSKRLRAVGGDPQDAALGALLQYFNAAKLPASATRRGCIQKDATLHFCRTASGELIAVANGERLTVVSSPKLCEAVFDLYLGEAPVCKRAKSIAARNLTTFMTEPLGTV